MLPRSFSQPEKTSGKAVAPAFVEIINLLIKILTKLGLLKTDLSGTKTAYQLELPRTGIHYRAKQPLEAKHASKGQFAGGLHFQPAYDPSFSRKEDSRCHCQ